MSSNFAGCCCFLVWADEQPARTKNRPCGSIVELTGMEADVFPGLYKVETITTNFAMVTCHSLIPDSYHLNKWKFSESFLGRQVAKKTLNEFVSGMISCCGEKSFLTPGPTTAKPHGGESCNLGLNCTVLFLNEKFKQHYTSHYGSPPSLDVSPCNTTRTISLIHRYLDLSRDGDQLIPPVANADNELEPDSDVSTSSGLFEIVTMSSNGRKVTSSAVDLCGGRDDRQIQESESASQSETQLAGEITKFQRVKVVKYKRTESSTECEDIGMPLLYVTPNDRAQLVGVLLGEGKVTISSAFFQLLQSNPAACLSLLINTGARRLWIHKWSHLLLPYLDNLRDTVQPRQILEILIILVKRKDNDEHFLYVNARDVPELKLGFLKLLQALFHHFSGQAKDSLTTMTAEVCTQAKVPLGNFLSEIRGLCESLSSIARDCCDYQNTTEPEIKPIVEHCFLCANEMLNFQHEQDVVEKVLCSDDFESTLNRLHDSCQRSPVIPTSLVFFYRKIHTLCKGTLASTTKALRCCEAELTSFRQKVNELETECSETKKKNDEMMKECELLDRKLVDASRQCEATLITLRDSEKRQKELNSENAKLKATVDDQTQQLQIGKESQLRLENDFNKSREDIKKLEDDGEKLKETNADLLQTRNGLQKEIECLKAVNDSLELRAKKQSESGHEMIRAMSDLTRKLHASQTLQKQRNSKSDSSINPNEVSSAQFSIAPPTVQEQADGDTLSSSEANLSGQNEQNPTQNT